MWVRTLYQPCHNVRIAADLYIGGSRIIGEPGSVPNIRGNIRGVNTAVVWFHPCPPETADTTLTV